MKSLVCLAITITIVLASDWKPKGNNELVQIRDECFNLENVTGEDKLKIIRNEYPDNPSVHCYVRCTSKKVGTWNDETGPDIDRTWKQIKTSGNTITREELIKCTPPQQDDKCLWAYQGLMCILRSEGVKSDLIKEV